MWISVKEYVVEERNFNLKNGKCQSGKVILQLIRRDVRISFFLFPKKVTQAICEDTHKKIKKSQWSSEVIAASAGMKANLKVPMWGFYTFGAIALIVFLAVPIGFYISVKDQIRTDKNFISENVQQRKYRLQALEKGDLVATSDKVYMISKIDNEYVTLIESVIPALKNNHIEKLTNDMYPKESFTGKEIKVHKLIFVTSRTGNNAHIINILDN